MGRPLPLWTPSAPSILSEQSSVMSPFRRQCLNSEKLFTLDNEESDVFQALITRVSRTPGRMKRKQFDFRSIDRSLIYGLITRSGSHVLRRISYQDWSQNDIWLESVPMYKSTAACPFPRGLHWPSASAITRASAQAWASKSFWSCVQYFSK